MNIGIDIRAIGRQRTGDETYTRGLVKQLLKIDQEHQYFLYTNTDDPGELADIRKKLEIDAATARIQVIPILPAQKMFWTFWSLPNYLRTHPIDVLHVQYITPQWLPAGITLVTTIHDISFNAFPQFIKKTDLLFLKTLIPLSLRRADKIIGVSEFTKREIQSYYHIPADKIVAVSNAVEDDFFEPQSPEKLQKIKAKYQLPDKFVFYVGTHQPRKNVPFLLEGFKKLKEEKQGTEEIDSLHLVLSGNRLAHNHDRRIDEILASLTIAGQAYDKYIHFPGYIDKDDLAAVYQLATVFCFPSLYEGFGIPILEAMASGTPVVCSDSSCLPEVAGGAACIFENNNQDDFTKKLFSVLIDRSSREDFVKKGQLRAREFSWEKAAKETLEVFMLAKKQE